jgi:hypothetical protein
LLGIQASIGEAHLRVKLKPKWCTRRYWLDVVGAAVLFVGVNCYNVMVAAELVESYLPPDTFSQDTHFALVRGPCIAGGTCFVVGGSLSILTRARRCRRFVELAFSALEEPHKRHKGDRAV